MNAIQSKQSKPRAGFTLVELLTVISVIVILAGLTLGTLAFVHRRAAVSKTKTQLSLMENGLALYAAETGSYPEGKDPSGLLIYKALFGDGVGPDGIPGTPDDEPLDGKPDDGAPVYLPELDPKVDPLNLIEGREGQIPTRLVDPFGNPWFYISGAGYEDEMENPDFDLKSRGPDGLEGTKDDLKKR